MGVRPYKSQSASSTQHSALSTQHSFSNPQSAISNQQSYTMPLPDLITSSRATQHTALSTLNSTNPAYLASLITTASDAIRRATHRDFSQTTYTEYHSGGIYVSEPLRLRQFPVLQISRVATTPKPALLIQNTDHATNQRATAETTPTSIRL